MCSSDLTFLMIDKLGTDKMPFFFNLKGRTEAMLEKVKIFRPHFTDRAMQTFSHLFPSHLPPRMKTWRGFIRKMTRPTA